MRYAAWWAVLFAAAALVGAARGDREPRHDDRFALVPVEASGGGDGGGGAAAGLRGELPCQTYSSNSRTCEGLNGSGSFNTTCVISSSSSLDGDLCVYGDGSVEIRPHVKIICPVRGCYITVNVSGSIRIGEHVELIGGSVSLDAANVSLDHGSTINTTALAGEPPPQTSGTPHSLEGAGGGHGGRGASCKVSNDTNWGGDVYAWSTLAWPWSYGSMGGGMSADQKFGGYGGGRVMLRALDFLNVDGHVLAEGGVGSLKGGGGSGGSIVIHAFKLSNLTPSGAHKIYPLLRYGNGTISAAGGNGWGGGGGGRISLDCYSIQQDLEITVHVSLWHTSISVSIFALPSPFSYCQVTGQIRLLSKGSICFGLSENPISEFELVAEELLMSDSVIKVYGAFRMYVKVLLMWDSKIQIDGGAKDVVLASMLEARNLVVLRHGSVISSNADLMVYGQGLLNLSGPGDGIKARRLFLSLFYNIEICRVEDITVSGIVRGSIIHIHRARTVTIVKNGTITASELGCKEGIGKGKFQKYGAGGGAGHGGRGGTGIYNGMISDGGLEYGNADLPCELGSGSGGSAVSADNMAGGGLIVIGSMKWPLSKLLIYGSMNSDGQSHRDKTGNSNVTFKGGVGGGSGGSILLFLQGLLLEKNSSLSASGGSGGVYGGGGGGGGRIHFHWSNIATGDEYVQIASVNGTVASSGGSGKNDGHFGEDGTITGKKCPVGLYGTFCTVPGASKAEETQSHVHRMYFMGPNTFREPWHLPYSPPDAIIGIVYEDAFNRFIDEINLVAAYEWWEGSIHSILSVLAYPCAWSWKQWCRRKKIHRLQEYVKSEYDHSCLRSCRSRALYKGLKVGSTPDLMVAYIDFFLGGDEKRLDVASTIQKRFPMCLIFGGDGSYMSPYYLHSDTLLSNLLGQVNSDLFFFGCGIKTILIVCHGQYVSTAIWNRLVAGLNAQLRTVRQGSIRSTLGPVVSWINSHGNPQLERHGVRVELGWFQSTASGYYQLGIVVAVNENFYKSLHPHEHGPEFGERSRFEKEFMLQYHLV
nr:unnamed protein product [Digitaria exilis]